MTWAYLSFISNDLHRDEYETDTEANVFRWQIKDDPDYEVLIDLPSLFVFHPVRPAFSGRGVGALIHESLMEPP